MFEMLVAYKTIAVLRVAVALAWGLIAAWGVPSFGRIITGRTIKGDFFSSSMLLMAAGLLILQFNYLFSAAPPPGNIYLFTGLASLLLSAIGIFVTRSLTAPDDHKRAALISHLILLILCLGAGALS